MYREMCNKMRREVGMDGEGGVEGIVRMAMGGGKRGIGMGWERKGWRVRVDEEGGVDWRWG